jgi:hypothetical protein
VEGISYRLPLEAVAAWHGSLIMTLFAITFTLIAIILIALFNLGVEPPL